MLRRTHNNPRIRPVPPTLSSLLHRTRAAILVLLLVVLPLQGVAQLVAGVQGHRHVHAGAVASAAPLSAVTQALRGVLDHLHAAQAPRFSLSPASSRGPAAGWHAHGELLHQHTPDTVDVLDVGDPADDPVQAGATAFLAWLPRALAWPVGVESDPPASAAIAWRDRVVAPPLTPPRG